MTDRFRGKKSGEEMGFKDKFLQVCSDIKVQTKKFADTVQDEYNKNLLKKEIDELYLTLGKARFAEMSEGSEGSPESVKLYEEIQRLNLKLSELEIKISDCVKCEVCGKACAKDAEFCPYCGTQIKVSEEKETEIKVNE
jgi:rRNA maturation endonuclease Nob1